METVVGLCRWALLLALLTSCRYGIYDLGAEQAAVPHATAANFIVDARHEARMLAFLSQPPTPDLKVLWWNISHGDFDARIFRHNLLTLVRSSLRPHVLILGEYIEHTSLRPDDLAALAVFYPERCFFPYNRHNAKNGIAVFSERSIDNATYSGDVLAWTPPDASPDETIAYRDTWLKGNRHRGRSWTRSYQRIDITHQGKRWHVIPLHLVNPWQVVATSGGLRLFYSLNFSAQSPLMHQVQHLYRALERDLGDVPTLKHTVLLGDFNIPKVTRVPTFFTQRWGFPMPFRTRAYASLRRQFRDAFPTHDVTFPTELARHKGYRFPNMQIDHAFVSRDVQVDALVVPLAGSDHYPLYVVLR